MSAAVPPEVVETVARAIHGAGWSDSTKHGPQYASFDAFMEHLARAAIAAMPPSPAEEALRLIDRDGCENLSRGRCSDDPSRTRDSQYTSTQWCPPCIARAALVSPAPAPHTCSRWCAQHAALGGPLDEPSR